MVSISGDGSSAAASWEPVCPGDERYIWADLQGPGTVMFVFQVPKSYSLFRLPVECL